MNQMEAFKTYLEQQRYRPVTVAEHLRNAGYFLQWLEAAQLDDAGNVEYKHLLEYVQHERQRGIDVATINLRLGSIRRYYEFLNRGGLVSGSPAAALHIKGRAKTVIEYPFTPEELQQLYHHYQALEKKNVVLHQRNVIIVGLLVWQGLHSGELGLLTVHDVELNGGFISIPGTARSNGRQLPLQARQAITLHTYMHGGVRERLRPEDDALLPGSLKNVLQAIVQELKGIEPRLRNLPHIRSSVILNWLKRHHKRQAQYMAGHKYISSTEAYAVQETDSLSDALSKHHPFG
jgi:site-specific recombinase XerD